MSNLINSKNLYSVNAAENQPVVVISGIAIPVGLLVESQSDIDLSEITVTADDILAGKISLDSAGNTLIGNIETVALSNTTDSRGYVAYVPKGFIPDYAELVIPYAPAPNVNEVTGKVTIYPGYQDKELTITIPTSGGDAVGVDELELFDWITIMSNY